MDGRFLGNVCAAALIAAIIAGTAASAADTDLCRHDAAIAYAGPEGAQTPLVLAAQMLAHDVTARCGTRPGVAAYAAGSAPSVLIGRADDPGIKALLTQHGIDAAQIRGKWESYGRVLIPGAGGGTLVIFGSDTRGAVWGVVDLTREIGVSAWQWWADVTPRPAKHLPVAGTLRYSAPPTVKYRALFLNDEDFALHPWASDTYDPQTHDIGPKTYARIFELMWRLKANTIWPAMHAITMSFDLVPGNAEMADRYAIVHGTSHAEPMLRTNLHEWNEAERGPFNYLTNRQGLLDYWDQAVAAHKGFENLYTVGLRGIHDSPMEGVATPEQTAKVLADVIGEQRKMLARETGRPVDRVPQIFVPYKEVLDAYDAGLKLPDDITIVWPDDNHGYIRRLPDANERARSGGAGVYYHISYWGAPTSYLWLATTHPALVWEEMHKAAHFGADRVWVLNAGDIKPGEYLTQLFFDMAFDIGAFPDTAAVRAHLKTWLAEKFGAADAPALADILWRYYDLANLRRPEFMAWDETYPTTAVRGTDFNLFAFGDEGARRLAAYRRIADETRTLAAKIPADRRDAFFELVGYPVQAAAAFNERILELDTAIAYGRMRRASANQHAARAGAAQKRIDTLTAAYNQTLAGGKWRGMMNAAPHRLPGFAPPALPVWQFPPDAGCAVLTEGGGFHEGGAVSPSLPAFHRELRNTRFLDLFVKSPASAGWSAKTDADWIVLSRTSGRFAPGGALDTRLTVAVDWAKAPPNGRGRILLRCGDGPELPVAVRIAPAFADADADFLEVDRIVSIYARHASRRSGRWDDLDGLGQTGGAIGSPLDMPPRTSADAPALEYRFATATTGDAARLRLFALPTWPLAGTGTLRVTVSIDGGAETVLDLAATEFSRQWTENVLRNMAIAETGPFRLSPGAHTLRVKALDPGILLDRFEIAFTGAQRSYGPVPETRRQKAN